MTEAGKNNAISDFFGLRRFFTRGRIAFVWYAFLVVWAVEFAGQTLAFAAALGDADLGPAPWIAFAYAILTALIYLLCARLVLEIALAVLSDKRAA